MITGLEKHIFNNTGVQSVHHRLECDLSRAVRAADNETNALRTDVCVHA